MTTAAGGIPTQVSPASDRLTAHPDLPERAPTRLTPHPTRATRRAP